MFFLVCIFLFSSVVCVNAEESEFEYKGFYFKYDNYGSSVYPVLVINCDYPEDIPHKEYPYYWNPNYYTSRESCLLDLPDSDLFITGSFVPFYAFEFKFDEISPYEGDYRVEVIQDGSKILFQKNITLDDVFYSSVSSVSWKYKTSGSGWSYKDTIDDENVDSIIGINMIVNVSNIGDVPFSVGGSYLEKLPISYKFDIYKDGTNEHVFSHNLSFLKRSHDLIEGNNNENTYFKPNETIEYSEDFATKNDVGYVRFDVGDYFITGEVHIGEHVVDFRSDDFLSITKSANPVDSSPGFEMFFVVVSLFFVLIYCKKKK